MFSLISILIILKLNDAYPEEKEKKKFNNLHAVFFPLVLCQPSPHISTLLQQFDDSKYYILNLSSENEDYGNISHQLNIKLFSNRLLHDLRYLIFIPFMPMLFHG